MRCENIKMESCVQVKNRPCVVYTIIMRLISWKRSRGRETVRYNVVSWTHKTLSSSVQHCAIVFDCIVC